MALQPKAIALIRLLRINNWIKNVFIFSGLFFSTKIEDLSLTRSALVIFAQFCLLSSAVYCLNDIQDRKADAQHPTKKSRPLPSGLVSIPEALGWFAVLLTLSVVLMIYQPQAVPFLITYFLLNLAYTYKLKDVVILDVIIISLGFLIRILSGTYPLGILPSNWLLFCGFSLAFFISLSKRYLERKIVPVENHASRRVLSKYHPDFLKIALGTAFTQTLIGYTLYISESDSALVYITLFPVLHGMLSYLLMITRQDEDDPVKLITSSKEIILSFVVWVSIFAVNLYLRTPSVK